MERLKPNIIFALPIFLVAILVILQFQAHLNTLDKIGVMLSTFGLASIFPLIAFENLANYKFSMIVADKEQGQNRTKPIKAKLNAIEPKKIRSLHQKIIILFLVTLALWLLNICQTCGELATINYIASYFIGACSYLLSFLVYYFL